MVARDDQADASNSPTGGPGAPRPPSRRAPGLALCAGVAFLTGGGLITAGYGPSRLVQFGSLSLIEQVVVACAGAIVLGALVQVVLIAVRPRSAPRRRPVVLTSVSLVVGLALIVLFAVIAALMMLLGRFGP